jgi:hypothetical protein
VLGLIAVGAIASPASAHTASIQGRANCETATGQYVITWTISNDFRQSAYRGRVNALPEGSIVALPDREIRPYGSIQGVQRLPGNSRSAGIELDRVTWEDGTVQDRDLRKMIRLAGNCGKVTVPPGTPNTKPPAPPANCVPADKVEFTHTFNGATGTATVSLDGKKPVCAGGDQSFALISYTSSKVPGAALKKFDSSAGVISPKLSKLALKVKLPPCYTKVYLVWGSAIIDPITTTGAKYGDSVLGSIGKPGNGSKGPVGVYEGGSAECTARPSVTFANTCDNVTISLINDGIQPAVFVGASKVGDGAYKPFSDPVTVDPGKKATLGVNPALPGLSVKVTSGTFSQEHSWTAPAACANPSPSDEEESPSPSPGAGGGLPVTGAGLGGLIAAAIVATGLGTALVVLARRRRRAV